MKILSNKPIQEKLAQTQIETSKHSNKETCSPTPPKILFNPSKIFYDSQSGSYLVDVGKFYRRYSRKQPVMSGVRRQLEEDGDHQDVESLMEDIELDRAVDWSGSIAGYKRGKFNFAGRDFLVMDEANLLDAKGGEWPLHRDILEQALPDDDARAVFMSWLRDGVRAVRKHHHHPAPMLVMAGQRNAGKSLIAHITQQALGGRASNPMATWSGKTLWNDELLKSELLLIDDSEASTDIRARKSIAANFKESIYAGNIKIHTRGKTALDMRPVWRVMICCNETPENLAVIPPLEEGIEDKIILLRINPIKTPMPAQSVDEKKAFSNALQRELPAFLSYLESFTTPEHLSDSRDGVTAWKDSELLEAIQEISPERKLENLIVLWLESSTFLNSGESKSMSAAELEADLQHKDCPTSDQARNLLKYHSNCGRLLSTLLKQKSKHVTGKRKSNGTYLYEISRP